MAEIGDVTRFTTAARWPLLQALTRERTSPENTSKKRPHNEEGIAEPAQGRPYDVYMTAGANKFLRLYYGRVKEYLSALTKAGEA